jgi:hypothetical protein
VRKVLPIPGVIEGYNTSMGMVDQANQLRSYFTSLPNRTQKDFFPGVFWSFDYTAVNCYKIFIAINPQYTLYRTGNRKTEAHRNFQELLIDEIFQYTDETLETFPVKPLKKAVLIPRAPGRPSLARIRSEPSKTPISSLLLFQEAHKHEKTTKRSFCLCCSLFQRIAGQNKTEKERNQRFRGTSTKWKCTICGPICINSSCWDYIHSTAFKGQKRKYKEIVL